MSVDLLSLFVNRIRSQHSKASVGTPLESVHCKDEKEPLHESSVHWQQWCVNRIVSSKWRPPTRASQGKIYNSYMYMYIYIYTYIYIYKSFQKKKDPVLEIWIFSTISYEFRWKFLYCILLLSNFSRKKDLPFHPATPPRNRTVPPPDLYVSCCGALTVSIGLKWWTFGVVRRMFLRRTSCVL